MATKRYLTRAELAEYLTSAGFPISRSKLEKLAMAGSERHGPPVAAYWANRALYDPRAALTWAKGRLRTNWRQEGRP
jgi:hypothetical protein